MFKFNRLYSIKDKKNRFIQR